MTSRQVQLNLAFRDAVVGERGEPRIPLPSDRDGVIVGGAAWPGEVFTHTEGDPIEGLPPPGSGTADLADGIDVLQRRRQPVRAARWTPGDEIPRRARTTHARVVPGGRAARLEGVPEEAVELDCVPTGGVAGEMPRAALAITRELLPYFDGLLPATLVHDYVSQAVSDLTGSISVEALPEMAIRLAGFRLDNLLAPDQAALEAGVPFSYNGSAPAIRYPANLRRPSHSPRQVDDVTPIPPVARMATTAQRSTRATADPNLAWWPLGSLAPAPSNVDDPEAVRSTHEFGPVSVVGKQAVSLTDEESRELHFHHQEGPPMNDQSLKSVVVEIQRALTAIPVELDGIVAALGDLDELLGEVSRYSRELSVVVEGLPGRAENLRVNELDGQLSPEMVCEPAAVHLQAAAAGIDQAKSAVNVAHRLAGRLY